MFIFVISWVGHHDSAVKIAEQVKQITDKVAIVYSDSDSDFVPKTSCQLIRRPSELFWEDKFKACLDHSLDQGMMVIHADCDCEDWRLIVERCKETIDRFKDVHVWAPKIDGTPWDVSASAILKVNDTDLTVSAMTDGIVFYLSPQVTSRMKQVDYGGNKFGWGIDGLFCANAYVNNKFVVIDTGVTVYHPLRKTGYDKGEAMSSEMEFVKKQFTHSERIQYKLLRTYVEYSRLRLIKASNLSST